MFTKKDCKRNYLLNKKTTIFDFHTHMIDIEELKRQLALGIYPVVNCRNAKELEMYENVCGEFSLSLGKHPWDSNKNYDFSKEYELDRVEFIGEIGMDSCWCDIDKSIQRKVFLHELDMAKRLNKPVILHTKGMEKEILEIISNIKDMIFIVHWYSCENFIDEYIDTGAYFTVGLAVKFEPEVKKLVQKIPLDRILYETDGVDALKWLSKIDVQDEEMHDIYFDTLEEVSKIKGTSVDNIHNSICENSKRLLKI